MRLVIDTNVLVSALLSGTSLPAHLLDLWREGRFDLLTSAEQLDELMRVTRYPKLRERLSPALAGRLINQLRDLAMVVPTLPVVTVTVPTPMTTICWRWPSPRGCRVPGHGRQTRPVGPRAVSRRPDRHGARLPHCTRAAMTEPWPVPARAELPISPSGLPPLPAVVAGSGDQATLRFLEFFAAAIRNPHTRRAYARSRRGPRLARPYRHDHACRPA